MPEQKRYLYLAAGTIMMLFLGLIYAWSIFRTPFQQIYPDWTGSDLSMTFTSSMIFFCLGGFASGKLSAKLHNRVIVLIAAVFLAVGFLLVSRLDPAESRSSLLRLYLFYGVLCGTGVGMGYNALISAVTKWFQDKTGFASGILLMGFGFGGLVLGSLVNVLIDRRGLFPTFFLLGIASAIVLVAGSFFVRLPASDPASFGGKAAAQTAREYAPAQMLRTPQFWIFFIWSIVVSSAGLLVINSAATIATAFGAPAILGLLVSVFNGGGRVLMGTLMDQIGRSKAMYLNSGILLLAGALLLLGAVQNQPALIIAGLLSVGISYGGSPALSSAVVFSFFGAQYYPVNFSINNFLIIPAAMIGPLVSSALLERSSGMYHSTFLMIIGFSVAAFALNLLLGSKRFPDEKVAGEPRRNAK